ncbi:fructose-6-phosphate aldolase [Amphibacillus cookii]|uniref:fructose-6-phosphate aldolase n=1 Tax=Amphibacillus cookii TaxID=767787 RepID=UPI00195AA762|nr:fructose-6-phosphate aldolase [Amphibacillus cookii]MBM7542222.1 TalC/MipB family fructose-6-phosphate aldolase [Amphibacillus cookii]
MELMLDTVNLEAITRWVGKVEVSGVTSNPTIIKKEGKVNFFKHMNTIRDMIGNERSLHVQVVADDFQGMIKDAEMIVDRIDDNVYVKVPINEEGIKAIRELKRRHFNVTATAVYTTFQAYLAIEAAVDYIAPYYNRMENFNINPQDVISKASLDIANHNSQTKILAASFKNIAQINAAVENGAHSVTVGSDVLDQAFSFPAISKAVADFKEDWRSCYGIDNIHAIEG